MRKSLARCAVKQETEQKDVLTLGGGWGAPVGRGYVVGKGAGARQR